MRAQHELGGMMGPQSMARILAMGGQEGFEAGNASSSGSVPLSRKMEVLVTAPAPGRSNTRGSLICSQTGKL